MVVHIYFRLLFIYKIDGKEGKYSVLMLTGTNDTYVNTTHFQILSVML